MAVEKTPLHHRRPIERIHRISDRVADPQPNQPKNSTNYILIALLVIASFLIGNLYTRVKYLEKGTGTPAKQDTAQQAGGVSPAPQAEIKIYDDDPAMGPKNAKVTVVTFEDFQCPYCGAFSGLNQEVISAMQQRDKNWQPALSNLIKDYVNTNKVRLVWKDYPFLGDESKVSAQAARCAQDQGKFWQFHDYLFSHQSGENQGSFSKDNLKKFAQDLGLNTADFNNCLDSGKYEKKINDAFRYGQSVGVNGTPATYINGQLLSGAQPYSQIKTVIDAELKK